MTTTPTAINVPLPAGALEVHDWGSEDGNSRLSVGQQEIWLT